MSRERLTAVSSTPWLVVQALAWDRTGDEVTFHEASNGESSSVLPFLDHADLYPDITVVQEVGMTTTALTDVPDIVALAPFDFVNLDIQGAELRALIGLGSIVDAAHAVYSEVNTRELYAGCAQLSDLDDFMAKRSFTRVDTQMTSKGWGDALWLREDILPRHVRLRRTTRRLVWEVRRVAAGASRRAAKVFLLATTSR